jgi:Spy/CpxP family protein refolding chaperone
VLFENFSTGDYVMKKLTKSLLAMTLVVSSIGLITVVSAKPFADGPGCGRAGHHMMQGKHDGRRGPNLERLADRLDMTEQQRAEVKAILDDSRQQMVKLREQIRENRTQLRELTGQDEFDEAAVRSIADNQGDLKAETIVLRARQRHEMKAVLTDEQRVQLDEMWKRKNHRGGGKRL